MSIEINFPFLDPANYIRSDENKIEISNGCRLKLIGENGDFTEDYTDDTGFTYDSDKAEFSGGKIQQKSQIPTNAVLGITYSTDEKIKWGQGQGTGTLYNSAVVSSEFLDVTAGSTACAQYTGLLLPPNAGAIKYIWKPDFNGAPGVDGYMWDTTGINEAYLLLRSTGALRLIVKNDAGATSIDVSTTAESWVQGQEYEILVNWNISGNLGNIYIDGTRRALDTSAVGSRVLNPTGLSVGAYQSQTAGVNGFIKDLIIYNSVQETDASYTPGYTLPEKEYVTTVADLPDFVYPGEGDIQSFTNLVTVDTDATYIMNGNYWNGSAWVASNGTRAQSSPVATILANIASMPVSNTFVVSVAWADSNTQGNADNLILSYQGQAYPQDYPWVEPTTSLRVEDIHLFEETAVKGYGAEIYYKLKKGTQWFYHNGVIWTLTDGTTIGEWNTAAEVDANKSTLIGEGEVCTWRAFIGSDGIDNVNWTNLKILYDYYGETPDSINRCIVSGYARTGKDDPSANQIKAKLNKNVVKYKTNTIIDDTDPDPVTPDTNGYYEIKLVENENMEPGSYWIFTINGYNYRVTVPDEDTKQFNDISELLN